MNPRGEISLGDLLDAFTELKADEAARVAIARLLGFKAPAGPEDEEDAAAGATDADARSLGDDARAEAARRVAGRGRAGRYEDDEDDAEPAEEEQPPGPDAATQTEEDAGDVSQDGAAPALEEDVGPVIPSRVRRVGDDKGGVQPLRPGASLLPAAAGQGDAAPRAFEPLLLPLWTRAILSGALSSRSDDGPLDIKRVVEQVAAGEPSASLPRFARPTLARGVQVLVDRSETMLPFLEDQSWLEAEIQKVVGEGRAQILYFEGYPTRKAGRGGKRGWEPYMERHLPSSGTVVLLLTDLGVGYPPSTVAPAGAGEWLAFADRLRRRGCPIVAFVPYAPERCHPALHRLMTIIQWDRGTSASSIHARVGKGHA
ncbi:MAG TPA: hypothetical protein VEX60_17140 [Pyrinomonadaceae bacterium]|nr:hypothetical protein [Pyrinomonadaceae bacterium]